MRHGLEGLQDYTEGMEGYKRTEVGVIPVDWKEIPLGEVLTLQRGFDLPQKNRQPGSVPVISSSGDNGKHSEAKVKSPGVVTGRYGTISQVFFVDKDFWPLNTTLFVKDFKGNNPLFISFLLRTIDYKSCSDKSGVPGVNRNDLHQIGVKLPPLSEQKAIAELNQTPNIERLQNIKKLLAVAKIKVKTSLFIEERAAEFQEMGFSSYDATHIASAERSQADVFLTTDDRLLKKARKNSQSITVNIDNPVQWLAEITQMEDRNDD